LSEPPAGSRFLTHGDQPARLAEAARVIEVTASPDVLAARLALRARESTSDAAVRLARTVALPSGVPMVRILNDGILDRAVGQILAALLE
jgi:ribose 1,5-bisphosphokinase PhnN